MAKFHNQKWTIYTSSNSDLPDNRIASLLVDNYSNVWVSTKYGGVARFDGTKWNAYHIERLCSGNYGNSLSVDTQGNVWIGTLCRGLCLLKDSTWTYFTSNNSDLPDNNVSSVFVSKEGIIWAGTNSSKLVQFNGTEWKVINPANSGLPNNSIWGIAFDNSGVAWIGTERGVARFDGKDWTTYDTLTTGVCIRSIAVDFNGDVWILTINSLKKFDGTGWLEIATDKTGLPDPNVNDLAISHSGLIWVGTSSGGLAQYDGVAWTVYDSLNSGLPTNNISSLYIDNATKTLWIGTLRGLVKFSGTIWTVYDTSNSGLPENHVVSIASDENTTIWAGTRNNKIAEFNGTNWTVHEVSNNADRTSYVMAVALDKAGTKWIGIRDYHGLAQLSGNKLTWYTSANSNLLNDNIYTLAIDGSGFKRISTQEGLAVFRGGEISVKREKNKSPVYWQININNRFSNARIELQIAKPALAAIRVYDLSGKTVKLVQKKIHPGVSSVLEFCCNDLSPGIYFVNLKIGSDSYLARLPVVR